MLEQSSFLIDESNLHCVDVDRLTGPTALPEVTERTLNMC